MRHLRDLCLLALPIFAFGACEKDDGIKVYRVSKPADLPPSPPTAALGQMPPAAPGSPEIPTGVGEMPAWQIPAGWQQKPPGAMRKATFAAGPVGELDLSVSSFPGDVGGDLANVNRWRQQLGLGPIDEAALAQVMRSVPAPEPMKFVKLEGAQATTLAAWTVHAGQSWFFKLTGPKESAAAEQDRFEAFLQSVTFHP